MYTKRLNELYSCAHKILNNECPPDNRAYLCWHGEEFEQDCIRCWENYLTYVYEGRDDHPYQSEVNRAKVEGRIGKINF